MDLRGCVLGSAVEVRWIDLDDGERSRLRELGIREGALLHVVNCGAFGAKVVALGSDRFAIDGRTCACIAVIPQAESDNIAIISAQALQPLGGTDAPQSALSGQAAAQTAGASQHNAAPLSLLARARQRRALARA